MQCVVVIMARYQMVVICVFMAAGVMGGRKFPPGFKFGAATSSYQIEGGWNADDKGMNMFDTIFRDNSSTKFAKDGSNGDVACDSYHQWQRDVEMAHELGLHYYRFSVSWTRILPTGFANKISSSGARYYNNLIDGLLERGIEPIVTIYHYDLPQSIQHLGGWANPLIADWFGDYAKVVYSLFGDRVKTWITINEPLFVCDYIYNTGEFLPRIIERERGAYICNKNVLLAHARAWRIYDVEYKKKYNGKVSIANNPLWIEPATEADHVLAMMAREFGAGRYSHPIYSKDGGWPPLVENLMKSYSHEKGYSNSTLPPFTEEERKYVQGTYDYYCLNHYSSKMIRSARPGEEPGVWAFTGSEEMNAVLINDPSRNAGHQGYLPIVPEGLRRQIAWINEQYGNQSILISENGFGTFSPQLYDEDRIEYFRDYLEQVLISIEEDGADIKGFTAWSLMDNFEWSWGYSLKYGLYHVDFSDPMRKRTPRASALFYANVIKHHSLNKTPTEDLRRYYKPLVHNGSDNTSHLSFIFIILYAIYIFIKL